MNSTSQENDSMAKGDMLVNNLIYRQPQQLSLAVNRTMKRQQFQRKNYEGGDTAVINWNTGSDYIKTYNSSLNIHSSIIRVYTYGKFWCWFCY